MQLAMNRNFNRRQFLRTAAGAAVVAAAGVTTAADKTRAVAIVVDPADAVASSMAARWAAEELERALTRRSIPARIYEKVAQVPSDHLRIVAAGMSSHAASAALNTEGVRAEAVPEGLALCQGKDGVWACGHDGRAGTMRVA